MLKEIHLVTYELEIEASLELVFEYLYHDDKVLLWSSLLVENIYENEADKENYRVGMKFTSVQKAGKKQVEAETVITEFDPPYLIRMEARSKEGISLSSYELTRVGANTRLTLKASMIPSNRFYHLFYSLIGKFAKYALEEEMKKLAELVEEEEVNQLQG